MKISDIINLSRTNEKSRDFNNKNKRFIINLNRLESLLDVLMKNEIGIKSIYFSDYIQSVVSEPMKLNLHNPVFCNNEYINNIMKILSIQNYRNTKTNNSSFSPFLFNRLNKVCTFIFKVGSTFSITLKDKNNLEYVEVVFPIDGYLFKNKGKRPLDYVKQVEGNKDWSYFTIEDIVNNEEDIKHHNYADTYINEYLNKNPIIVEEFKDFICNSLNTEIKDDIFLKNILWTMWASLLVGDCQSFTYIPSVIRKDAKEKDISSGGLIIPQFQNQKTISLDLVEELYLLVQVWFSKNAVADFSKLSEITVKQEDNIKQLHTLSSGITNIANFFKQIKKLNSFKTKKESRLFSRAEEKIKRLSFVTKAVLSLDKKIKGGMKPEFILYTKEIIFEDTETIIDQEKTKKRQEFRNKFLDWVRNTETNQWINFDGQDFFEVEESFQILMYELLKNAIEFTDRENIKLEVILSKKKEYLLLEIVNTMPMYEKIQEYINSNFSNYSNIPVVRGHGLSIIEKALSFLNGVAEVYTDRETQFTHFKIKIYKYEQNHYLSS